MEQDQKKGDSDKTKAKMSPALVAEKTYEKNIGSIVVVRTGGGQGGGLAVNTIDGEGSGVVVGDNLIATNCHVVDSGGQILVSPANSDQSNLQPVEAKIVAASDRDLCLLETKGLSLPPVKIGAAKALKVGNPVYAIGVPLSLGGTLSDGIVSRLWTPPAGSSHLHALSALPGPLIQTNVDISPGSSGGGLFDMEGRLVGITSFGRGNLNFAIPAEMVRELQERDEKKLRSALSNCLDNPNPENFNLMALGIAKANRDPAIKLRMLTEIGHFAARFGNNNLAAFVLRHLGKVNDFAKTLESEPEIRDLLAMLTASIRVNMGAEHIDDAIKMVEKIDHDLLRGLGYTCIVQQCARHEKKPFEKARTILVRISKIKDIGKIASQSTEFVQALAAAMTAVYESEDALALVEKIRETKNPSQFLGYVDTLAGIAAELKKHSITIGALTIFHFALHAATEFRARGVGTPERLVALGNIAVYAAECGADDIAAKSFHSMQHIRGKGSTSDISGDRTPDISYHREIQARGLEAIARAIIGGPSEILMAIKCMKCIPVLEHLPAALVCASSKWQRHIEATKEQKNEG